MEASQDLRLWSARKARPWDDHHADKEFLAAVIDKGGFGDLLRRWKADRAIKGNRRGGRRGSE